jgi:outer membrane receptor protein involved in Fe transport
MAPRCFVIVLAGLVPAASALAAEPGNPPAEPQSAPIVVTGRGLSAAPALPAYDSVVIDRERINATASGRIEDALSSVAGFQQFRRSDSRSSNPSAQGVTLRALGGNATSRTLVLLDGVPMADPFFGYIPFSAFPPGTLASARITRGGGAGAFGAGAVAGSIDLTSAGPSELGLASGSALVDDRGDTEVSGLIAPRLGEGFVVASGQWDRGQGFWTTPEGQRGTKSVRARYNSWSGGVRAVTPLGGAIELQARVAAFDDRRTLRFAGADSRSRGQDASLRLIGRGPWQFEALGYVQARDFSNVVISATSLRKTLDQYATPTTGVGGKLELRPPVGGGHVLRLGSDLRIANGYEAEVAYSAQTGAATARRRTGGRNSDLGLYAEDDWTIGPLVLTGGIRADRWTIASGFFTESTPAGIVTTATNFARRSGWDTSLRGGAVFHATRTLALRGSAYSGLRQPTLNELYRSFTVTAPAPGGGVALTRTLANATLDNEELQGFEGGIDFTPLPAISLSATWFDNRVRHAIANVTTAISGTTTTRLRQNVDAVRSRGIELDASLRLGQVSLAASWAFTRARVEASGASVALDGLRPAQTPREAGSATLAWAPRPGWRLAATLRHTGAQFEDDLQSDVLPAATTLDAYFEVPVISGFSLVLRGENLTDESVITRNQGGSLDLGTPRTVWAGFKARLP